MESICTHLNIVFSFPVLPPKIPPGGGDEILKPGDRNSFEAQFEQFIMTYERVYISEQREIARQVFEENLIEINAHNERPTRTYTKGINQFIDVTREDFATLHIGMLKSDLHVHTGL